MKERVERARALARRYRSDRRLPPVIWAIFRDVLALRVRSALTHRVAPLRPPLGGRPSDARLGARRVRTVGALDCSTDELAFRYADAVVQALAGAGIDTFLVERRGDRLVFGVDVVDRPQSLAALGRALGDEWLVEFDLGSRTHLRSLARIGRSRRAKAARAWRLFAPVRWGDTALGVDQAAELTFWERGTSGQHELVGTRGQFRFDERSPRTTEHIGGRTYPGRRAFPVAARLDRIDEPIDIVYTWVDGSEPTWREAFQAHARASGRRLDEGAFDPARFNSRDELRYSMRSVWAFAGWARHIYVVTAGQCPAWLTDHAKVTIVDHSEILPADALPTFNSHAIESALHRIEGLSERFVYFNDDVFLGRPIRPEHFFTSSGLPWVFLSSAPIPGFVDAASLDVDRAADRGRELLVERFGRLPRGKPYHTPFPLLRSVMNDIEVEFPDAVAATERSRFRAPTDLSVASSFAQLYAVASGRGVLGSIANSYVNVESGRLRWFLDQIRLGHRFDTFCINETEQRARQLSENEVRIRAFLDEFFPVAAPWECEPTGTPE